MPSFLSKILNIFLFCNLSLNSTPLHCHLEKITPSTTNTDAITDINLHNSICRTHIPKILISVDEQKLYHINQNHQILKQYPVSTAKNGTGELSQSNKTPRGWFQINQKIGNGYSPDQNFSARSPCQQKTGITTRILTLQGLQSHNQNTAQRCIYIHGTPFTTLLGTVPKSFGCIRMKPDDIIDLYTHTDPNTLVYIYDSRNPLTWQPQKSMVS